MGCTNTDKERKVVCRLPRPFRCLALSDSRSLYVSCRNPNLVIRPFPSNPARFGYVMKGEPSGLLVLRASVHQLSALSTASGRSRSVVFICPPTQRPFYCFWSFSIRRFHLPAPVTGRILETAAPALVSCVSCNKEHREKKTFPLEQNQ